MSNAILPETEQIWKDFTWNVKVPEKDNFWTRITSNMIVPEKEKIGTYFTSNVRVPEKENYWKEITSNMMVPEKDKSEKNTASVKVPDKETFWKELASNIIVLEKDKSEKISSHQMWKFLKGKFSETKITSYMIVLGRGKKLYKKTVSINERKECNSGKRL